MTECGIHCRVYLRFRMIKLCMLKSQNRDEENRCHCLLIEAEQQEFFFWDSPPRRIVQTIENIYLVQLQEMRGEKLRGGKKCSDVNMKYDQHAYSFIHYNNVDS